MVNAILITRAGELSSIDVKHVSDLYKKCKFRSPVGFNQAAEWSQMISGKQYSIRLYAKLEGKSMNKYVFPPPVDTHTFYGDCVLVKMVDDQLEDLSISEWTFHEEGFNLVEEATAEELPDDELEEEPYNYKN